jgi:hypothetical protein
MSPEIDRSLRQVERRRKQVEDAQNAAEEALTCFFEAHLAELAKRYPKRRFQAWSGNGSLSVQVGPGPLPFYAHHARRDYHWAWGGMAGPDRHWAFLWQPWEGLLDTFAKRMGEDYVNFTRDIDIKGELWEER